MFGKAKLSIIFLSALVVAYGVIGGMLDKVSARDDAYKELSIFTEVVNRIREEYVEEPEMEKVMKGALHGLTEALDPFSSFVDQQTYERIKTLQAATASPGMVLSKRYGYAHVVSVLPGSSAHREGLRSGDLLESIEGQLTTQMSLMEAEALLLGPAGSTLQVDVIRARRGAPAEITLVREDRLLPESSARIVDDGIGVLRITHFEPGSSAALLAKLKMLTSSGIRGLMVDVRGVAQGSLEEAVTASEFFLAPGQQIVSARARTGAEKIFTSMKEPVLSAIPVVVLVDGGSSGPAEVFAAALRDHGVAETVGERTDGNGSRRELFFLEDGSVLSISTQFYYRPSGKAIQDASLRNSGLAPDLRAPDEDFLTSFYFENMRDDPDQNPDDAFYRKLNEAIEARQFSVALERLRSKVLDKAA